MIGEWSASGDFFGSILAGLLLGLLADQIFETSPWFVVIGIVLGFTVGFWRMVVLSNKIIEEVARQRGEHEHGSEHDG